MKMASLRDMSTLISTTTAYGGFVDQASKMLRQKLQLPAGYTYQWSGEYEFQLRAKERNEDHLPACSS